MHQWALKDKLSVNLSNFVNKLKFNDFNELLKQICQNKWFVSLEPELQIKSSAPWLWIGPIQKITKKCIFIEAVGVQPKPIGTVRIRIEDTTIIEIKKKYTKVYESYMNKNNASNL